MKLKTAFLSTFLVTLLIVTVAQTGLVIAVLANSPISGPITGPISAPISTPLPSATLTVSPTTVSKTGSLNVTWSGIPNPHLGDYMNFLTADDRYQVASHTYWIQNNCTWFTPSSGTPQSSGTCTIDLSREIFSSAYPGPFHLVLYSGATGGVTTVLAKSNNFDFISASPSPTPSATPSATPKPTIKPTPTIPVRYHYVAGSVYYKMIRTIRWHKRTYTYSYYSPAANAQIRLVNTQTDATYLLKTSRWGTFNTRLVDGTYTVQVSDNINSFFVPNNLPIPVNQSRWLKFSAVRQVK